MRREGVMRKNLKAIGTSTRRRYKATVGRMGIKDNTFKNWPERTMLLKDLIDVETNQLITDHLWFIVHKQLRELAIKEGDIITFDARVAKYYKGYYHDKLDYKLNYMSKIELQRENRELKEGEITSATRPTYPELWEAQERARSQNNEEVFV